MLNISLPIQASLFIGPVARQHIMTKARGRLKMLLPNIWEVGEKRPKFTVSYERDTINNRKPPTSPSLKPLLPSSSRNINYPTKSWAHGPLEDIEHMGL